MLKEGQYHIPSGCAISGIFHKDGRKTDGSEIIRSIATMHDRSNGLGGGFAAYGIYPEYADCYAFHLFYDNLAIKEETEKLLEENFEIASFAKIPTRKHPNITDEPLIWRYFVFPRRYKLQRVPAG